MNAVNPVPASTAAEPSMEEILASIRRIIADDQSMPGHAGPPHEPLDEAPREPPAASLPPDMPVAAPEAHPDLPPEHGVVATPQFVSPEGPSSVMDTPHPLAPQHPPEVAGTGSVDAEELLGPVPDGPDLHEAALREMHEEPASHLHELAPEEPPMMTAHELAAPHMAAHDAPVHEATGEAPAGLFSAATSQSLAAAFNTLAVSRLADDSAELRELARGMLQPLLKSWLDENLPSLVETIIRDEIDRMSRRGR